jgi:CheY-like chemotaxis protein
VRVVVVHREAAEAVELAARLRRDGIAAEPYPYQGTKGFRELRANPPDAILIDLMRLPSYGRAMGAMLREGKATRSIPLVFLEGDPEKTQKVKETLPDAEFAPLPRVGAALRRAVTRPPSQPVVPEGPPVAVKLRLGDGASVGVVGAPEGFTIGGVELQRGRQDADVVLLFVRTVAMLARELRGFAELPQGRALWVLWQKRSSKSAGDVTFARINEVCAPLGLVGYKACAVDATWSAVAVARRRLKRQLSRR